MLKHVFVFTCRSPFIQALWTLAVKRSVWRPIEHLTSFFQLKEGAIERSSWRRKWQTSFRNRSESAFDFACSLFQLCNWMISNEGSSLGVDRCLGSIPTKAAPVKSWESLQSLFSQFPDVPLNWWLVKLLEELAIRLAFTNLLYLVGTQELLTNVLVERSFDGQYFARFSRQLRLGLPSRCIYFELVSDLLYFCFHLLCCKVFTVLMVAKKFLIFHILG